MRDGAPGAGGVVPRRDAAIFFVAPDVSAPLETIVREGEVPRYAGLLTHGEFKVCCCSDDGIAVLRGTARTFGCTASPVIYCQANGLEWALMHKRAAAALDGLALKHQQ